MQPYSGYFQPYCAWVGLVWYIVMVLCYGYQYIRDWSVSDFFSCYTILGVDVILYVFWKVLKRTKVVGKYEADLVWERPSIDAYEATFIDPPVGFWREMG